MIRRLPRWVWSGASALSFIAGIVNVVGLLGFEHQAITHLTGTTSLLAASVVAMNTRTVLHLAAAVLSFVLGTILSGYLIQDGALQLGRRYGVALLLECALLCLAVPFLQRNYGFGLYAASCACGLQNAMASTYSGAVVRTTHLSGMFTDLGILIGQSLRGLPIDGRRLWLCLCVIGGFFCGGVAGAVGFRTLQFATLFIPAALTALTAMTYWVYRRRN